MDCTVNIWSLETCAKILEFKGHEKKVISSAFSPDGKIIASGSEDETIKIWNGETG